jgi:hypothetical protein
MSDQARLMTPDEFQLWTRGELARIDQLHADADRKRQEMELAPGTLRAEMWKAAAAMVGTTAGMVAAVLALVKYLGIGP